MSPDLSAERVEVVRLILLTTPRVPAWPTGTTVMVLVVLTTQLIDADCLPTLASTVYFPDSIAGSVLV